MFWPNIFWVYRVTAWWCLLIVVVLALVGLVP
jgi:hypothetical protein